MLKLAYSKYYVHVLFINNQLSVIKNNQLILNTVLFHTWDQAIFNLQAARYKG